MPDVSGPSGVIRAVPVVTAPEEIDITTAYALRAALASAAHVADRERLERIAHAGLEHGRLSRLDGAERARGQANCRSCREPIARGSWRIRLVFFEEGRFHPAGFVHLACGGAYFECEELVERLLHFSPGLDETEREALRAACGA